MGHVELTWACKCILDNCIKSAYVLKLTFFHQYQARRVYEILRLKITDESNTSMYKQYRLDVKRRLNKPFQVSLREADEMLFFNGNFYLRVNVEQPSMYIMVKKKSLIMPWFMIKVVHKYSIQS